MVVRLALSAPSDPAQVEEERKAVAERVARGKALDGHQAAFLKLMPAGSHLTAFEWAGDGLAAVVELPRDVTWFSFVTTVGRSEHFADANAVSEQFSSTGGTIGRLTFQVR